MKKILTFISLFIMILTLSSCGVKKEIKEKTLPDGNTLDEESISQYAEEIKKIYDSEVENYNKLETSWYSISTDAITDKIVKEKKLTTMTILKKLKHGLIWSISFMIHHLAMNQNQK